MPAGRPPVYTEDTAAKSVNLTKRTWAVARSVQEQLGLPSLSQAVEHMLRAYTSPDHPLDEQLDSYEGVMERIQAEADLDKQRRTKIFELDLSRKMGHDITIDDAYTILEEQKKQELEQKQLFDIEEEQKKKDLIDSEFLVRSLGATIPPLLEEFYKDHSPSRHHMGKWLRKNHPIVFEDVTKLSKIAPRRHDYWMNRWTTEAQKAMGWEKSSFGQWEKVVA